MCLQYYIHERLNNDPGWKKIKGERNRTCKGVLWVKNDLFQIQIQLRIFRVPDPDPTYVF